VSRATPVERRAPAQRAAIVVGALVAVVVVIFVYWRGLAGPFVLDDEMSVAENFSIRRLSALRTVLSPPNDSTVGGRPVANLTFALDYAMTGLSPRGYRVTNLAIHAVATLLLFGIVRRTVRRTGAQVHAPWMALAVAAIWLLHPLQTATVAYISQRTEQLMALFYLLTIYAFIRGVENTSRRWFAVSVAACALGMGSKEVMVTAPVVVWLYDRTFVAGTFLGAWRARWRYYLMLGATWLLLAWFMSGGLNQRAVGFGLGITAGRYALTETEALTTYLRLAPWPHPLVFDYGPKFIDGIGAAAPFAVVVAITIAAVVIAVRRWPKVGFLATCFFVLLAPTSSVVPLATQPIAESRMYLPLACAVCLGVLALFAVVPHRARILCAIIVVACAVLSRARIEVLRDPLALWTDTLAKRPDNSRVHSNLGAALFLLGRTDEAMAHERRALDLDPNLPRVHSNYAAALLKKGKVEEALEHGRTALRLSPRLTDANYQVGNALAQLGRLAEAVEHYRAEIQLRPDYVDAYSNLGSALYMLGRPADAIPHFETALRLKPDFIEARNNLASALSQAGRANDAVQLYRATLAANPADVAVRCNLGIVLMQIGRLDEAEAELRSALQLRPDHAPARAAFEGLQRMRAAQKNPGK
jgi:protein O-mannosyl-transferase